MKKYRLVSSICASRSKLIIQRYVLVGGLCIFSFQALAETAREKQERMESLHLVEQDEICNFNKLPSRDRVIERQFIFNISCNEKPGIYRINGEGGRLSGRTQNRQDETCAL